MNAFRPCLLGHCRQAALKRALRRCTNNTTPKRRSGATTNESTNLHDLKLDRELPANPLIPWRVLLTLFWGWVGFCAYVCWYRYAYTRSVVLPMRQKMQTDAELKAAAFRDYDEQLPTIRRNKVYEDSLIPIYVPWPITMERYRRIPPPDENSPPKQSL